MISILATGGKVVEPDAPSRKLSKINIVPSTGMAINWRYKTSLLNNARYLHWFDLRYRV